MEVVLSNAQRGRRSEGFNLIEVLIAAVLFLVVALGVLPLFQTSIRTNTSGQNSTDVANLARSRVEEFMQIPYNSPLLDVTAGTENVIVDHYLRDSETWVLGAAPAIVSNTDPAIWERTTTIRWYNIAALSGDDGGTASGGDDIDTGIVCSTDVPVECPISEALPAGTDPINVHFKEIEVQVEGTILGGGIIGPGKRIVVRSLRSQ